MALVDPREESSGIRSEDQIAGKTHRLADYSGRPVVL